MTDSYSQIESVLARETDGTIQITLTIPYELVKSEQEKALDEYSKETEVPGFRKGKAPIEKVREKIGSTSLTERALSHILPKAFQTAADKFKIRPLIYPKFELVNAKDKEDWQIRAVTCEMPNIILGDYQKSISNSAKTQSIWTPDKTREDVPKEKTDAEKEQEVIKILLSTSEVNVPKPLIDEEVDARLAGLLERTEKLGLSLEKYLSSIGKTPQSLRSEYEAQAKEALKLDLVLSKIAEDTRIQITEGEIDEAIRGSNPDEKSSQGDRSPEQRRLVASILKKRKALDSLASLL